jgi:hypothetical protein
VRMTESIFSKVLVPLQKVFAGRLFPNIGTAISVISAMAVLAVVPAGVGSKVLAGSVPVPINMIYYGWMDSTTEQAIINAHPEFLVGNSWAGPWRSNANVSKFMSAGIKYFEYIDGGYESTVWRPIPTDLASNLNYVAAAAQAGAYGIFLDEVSDGVYTAANYGYLQQIADKAHSLGLKVAFNTGMFAWADQLMSYCDYINSTETWQDAPLTASQSKWASRTWLLTYGVYDGYTASSLTNAALGKGIRAHYATTAFVSFPSYFPTYISQIGTYSTYPTPPSPTYSTSPTPTGQASVTFNSTPAGVEVWLDYSYRGVTPLTIGVTSGNHAIGFNKYGYHSNVPVVGSLAVGTTSLTVTGDMVSGQITSSGTVSPGGGTSVSFTTNVAGSEVWLDYVYKGTAPLTLSVPAGSHHVGIYAYGYNGGRSADTDFYASGQTSLNVYTDMVTGFSSVW